MIYREAMIATTNRTTRGGMGELVADPEQFC